jgi:hypothetical protein
LALLFLGPSARGRNLDLVSVQGVLQWAPSKGFPFFVNEFIRALLDTMASCSDFICFFAGAIFGGLFFCVRVRLCEICFSLKVCKTRANEEMQKG